MWPLRSTPVVFTLAQSFCSQSWQRCCDSELYGPEGDVSCWRDGRTFESCCGGGRAKAAQADGEPLRPAVAQEEPALTEDFTLVSRRCWRSGYSFKFCCARHKPRGDASCWDETFTYERCCQPPVPRAEGTLLEDFDGLRDAPLSLQILLTDLKTLVVILGRNEFGQRVQDSGATLRSRLRRAFVRHAGAPRLASAVAELLLCLLASSHCDPSWLRLLQALRDDDLDLIRWTGLSWPIPELFRHLVRLVGPPVHVLRPACREVTHLDWPLFWEAAQNLPDSVESNDVLRLLFDMDKVSFVHLANDECFGGVLFTSLIKLGFCMDTTPDCVRSYVAMWRLSLETATESVERLKDWLSEASSWNLFELHIGTVESHMRHRFNLALSAEEYSSLGVLGHAVMGCLSLADARKAPRRSEHFIDSSPGLTVARAQETCRSLCGKSQDDQGRAWPSHALLPLRREGDGYPCVCSGLTEGVPGNCSQNLECRFCGEGAYADIHCPTEEQECTWPGAEPVTPYYWDTTCQMGHLGCNADGIHIECRFCEMFPFKSVRCPPYARPEIPTYECWFPHGTAQTYYWDNNCKIGILGCLADGIHEQCRYCGPGSHGAYEGIPCPASPTVLP